MASLLRRGLPALVLAGTGGALLARFDHTEAFTARIEAVPSTSASPSAAAAPTTVPSTPRPSAASPSTTVAPSACTGAETLGPVVQTKWGPVQVAAVISQGKICDVRAVVVPASHTRSVAINSRAVPVLQQRVLAAQSATFDTVSGATVTSDGYRSSLQAILNAAK